MTLFRYAIGAICLAGLVNTNSFAAGLEAQDTETTQAADQRAQPTREDLLLNNVINGDIESIWISLAQYPKVNVNATRNSWTPLHIAAANGRIDIARTLFNANADANATTHQGSTPLDLAFEFGHQDMVHLLLQHTSYVNCLKTLAFFGTVSLAYQLEQAWNPTGSKTTGF
jgi:ankyrin repeat protein